MAQAKKKKHIALKAEQPPPKPPGLLLPSRKMTRGQRLDVEQHNTAVWKLLAEKRAETAEKEQELLTDFDF